MPRESQPKRRRHDPEQRRANEYRPVRELQPGNAQYIEVRGEYQRGEQNGRGMTGVIDEYRISDIQREFAPVPEPSTVIAGALLLVPFGAGMVRKLRKNRTA